MNQEEEKKTLNFLKNMSNEDIKGLDKTTKQKLKNCWFNSVSFDYNSNSYFINVNNEYIKNRLEELFLITNILDLKEV